MSDNSEVQAVPKENGELVTGIKGVIFDMDGLMIDSEPLHVKAFDAILRDYGHELTEAENKERYLGISGLDCARDMVTRYQLPLTPEEVADLEHQNYMKLMGGEAIVQPGLMELLKQLKEAGFKIAIASGAPVAEIEHIIGVLKIESYIDSYTSAQEVDHGKPAPDIFLLAAKKMNEPPARCLVLEDAAPGIAAAEAAGMVRFAVPSRETKGQDFSSATKILGSLAEVFQLIQK